MASLIPPISSIQTLLQPLANRLGLHALPIHIHEILIASILYHVIFKYLAPSISSWLVPRHYKKFNHLSSLEWNLQCVSMVQSIVICFLGLYVIANDVNRRNTNSEDRVWGYSG